MIDWIKVALLVLNIVQMLLARGIEKRAIEEGEKNALLRGLEEVAKQAGIVKDVRDYYANMSDDDLLAAAEQDYRD